MTVANGYYDASTGKYVSQSREPFLQTDSLTVRCPSRLSADASPEPVRVGRTVTVKGHRTRTTWNAYRNPMQGYAGQRVLLQRRTATGTYHTLKSVRTDRRGYPTTGVKALSGTQWHAVLQLGLPRGRHHPRPHLGRRLRPSPLRSFRGSRMAFPFWAPCPGC